MTEDQETYRVGKLTDIRDDDPIVTGWDAAMTEAKRQYDAQEAWDDEPIGIWAWSEIEDYASLDGIYYEGWVFTP